MNDQFRAGVLFSLRAATLAGAAIALIGCQSIREAAGVVKTPPDEFAVVTKAPLVIPPNFNLRPPKPGAAPTNQSSATDSAQAALFGDDPATIAASLPTTYSPEERTLLATTGAATSDHSIRQQIAADNKSMQTASNSFTDQLLFSSGPDPSAGHPVDADAEHDRLAGARTAGQTPGTNAPPASTKPTDDEAATIKKDSSTDDEKTTSGGWFDGIF